MLRTHRQLCALNRARRTPRIGTTDPMMSALEKYDALVSETRFLEEERRLVSARAAKAPTDSNDFRHWFEELEVSGPGQGDIVFLAIRQDLTEAQMKWFLRQERAGETGLHESVALSELDVADSSGFGDIAWQPLALANLMAGLAAHHGYAFHTIGALAVEHLTWPSRAKSVGAGLRRLGYAVDARAYFAENPSGWGSAIILPLIEEDGACATAIAEGALMRLNAGARCFERYRHEFGLYAADASPPSSRREEQSPWMQSSY